MKLDRMAEHAFRVRMGNRNLSRDEWALVTMELRSWYPESRLEVDIAGEMGPFGVHVARSISITLVDGPDARLTAASVLRRALATVGHADFLDFDADLA